MQLLGRLDEDKEDAEDRMGVFNSLNLVENIVSIDPAAADTVFTATGLPKYLLTRMQRRGFDSNKQYASELLAILLQTSKAGRLQLATPAAADASDGDSGGSSGRGGLAVLLRCSAAFRRRDPRDKDEEEFLENVFDCVCCCLLEAEGRAAFVAEEGVELMIILLR
ncbi:hypothetical protein HK405_006399, partial [Cladochytrium tenue]